MYNNLHSMFGCYGYVDYYFTNNFLLQKEIDKLKKELENEKEKSCKFKKLYNNKQLDFLELKYNFDILKDKYYKINNICDVDFEEYEKI